MKRGQELSASDAVVAFGNGMGQQITIAQLNESIVAPDHFEVRGANLTVNGVITVKKVMYMTNEGPMKAWSVQAQQVVNWYVLYLLTRKGTTPLFQ